MTKKTISDLLREELNKEPKSQNTASEESLEAAKEESQGNQEIADSPTPSEKTPTRTKRTVPNQLEQTVKELTSALETVTDRANQLQNQVTSLESELKTQKESVIVLQEQLEQAQQMQSALEEQQKIVEHLTKELIQSNVVQEELAQQKAQVQKLFNELQTLQQASTVTSTIEKVTTTYLSPHLIGRFVAASLPPTDLSNEEIGWFD